MDNSRCEIYELDCSSPSPDCHITTLIRLEYGGRRGDTGGVSSICKVQGQQGCLLRSSQCRHGLVSSPGMAFRQALNHLPSNPDASLSHCCIRFSECVSSSLDSVSIMISSHSFRFFFRCKSGWAPHSHLNERYTIHIQRYLIMKQDASDLLSAPSPAPSIYSQVSLQS